MQSSATLFIFFASWGIWWSFFSTWLDKSLGLSGGEIGTVYSVNSLTTIAVMFFYGMVQDRLGLKRHLVILSSAVMASLAPFVIFVYQPLLQNAFGRGCWPVPSTCRSATRPRWACSRRSPSG